MEIKIQFKDKVLRLQIGKKTKWFKSDKWLNVAWLHYRYDGYVAYWIKVI